jgi:hypothetical protein
MKDAFRFVQVNFERIATGVRLTTLEVLPSSFGCMYTEKDPLLTENAAGLAVVLPVAWFEGPIDIAIRGRWARWIGDAKREIERVKPSVVFRNC